MQRGKSFSTLMAEIETQLATVDEGLVLIAAREDRSDDYLGVVLVYRPSTDDYITWTWNSSYPEGTYLHQGHYDMEYEEARMDFEARR